MFYEYGNIEEGIMEKTAAKNRSYIEGTHLYGRIATILAMLIMLAIPTVICMTYHVKLNINEILATAGPLLALFIPTALSEVISFTPITGSAGYIASIMGNVSNIKFPCALNAMETTNSVSGTERGDVMAMAAMCVSGMVTTVIVALGVILLVPLQPVLTTPAVMTATKYIMPALFGSMAVSVFINKNAGDYKVEGKMKIAAVPFCLVLAASYLIKGLAKNSGYVMLVMIPVTILTARIMYKKGMIKVTERTSAN